MPEPKRPLPYPEVDLEEVRRFTNRRADQSSVRQVAREMGLRHTAVTKFLSGSEPYAKTRVPICEWYLRASKGRPAAPDRPESAVEGAEDHLAALLVDLRGEARTEARLRIVSAISLAYRRMGLPEPGWLYTER
jgi:hypothetical protein